MLKQKQLNAIKNLKTLNFLKNKKKILVYIINLFFR